MSQILAGDSLTTAMFEALAASRRRHLLRALIECTGDQPDAYAPLSRLATEITSREQHRPIVADDHCSRTEIALVHRHVPVLVDAGIVVRESTDDGTALALADHPVFETDWVHTLLESPGMDTDRLDRTLDALAPARRRTICGTLATRCDVVRVDDLVTALVTSEDDPADERSSLTIALVHDHLPVLADVGLLEYDRTERTVALATDADLWRVEWASESPLESVTDQLDRSGDGRANADGGVVGHDAGW
ncbi:DUF7344 domain-containing protein [Natronobacterium gregoryi]|uniref:DUF7344 domain-containing protein n=2 Tax=Natronobacterium gregoryi TaxID=44930 RepID=L0AFH6_NATGS|nr:hypothetical protein [Natronobacterium gregoryi]AFZ72184.1 hypothetical protein Natgr_0953 [Natronobacterium gregoryi SP2]ELY63040.1 hypothetical protein C490_16496 [Natronobacterium gregoryi SP2]PLK20130.1 hypothetical protein CYV19_11305 [Natronobacterium gregoryi SP2]SFJ32587.1 hypothetical protein SAMN05443661_12219 [Natronobacterium gregoryi]